MNSHLSVSPIGYRSRANSAHIAKSPNDGVPIRMLDVNVDSQTSAHGVQTVDAEKTAVQIEIIGLIKAWSQQPKERWADLRSRARTQAANELIAHIRNDLEELEQKANDRTHKRRQRSRVTPCRRAPCRGSSCWPHSREDVTM